MFASRNVPVNLPNVTQSIGDFADLQSRAKVPGVVSENIAAQDQRLAEIAEEGIDQIRPTSQNLPETNNAIFTAIDNRVVELDNIVSDAYTSAREVARQQEVVRLDGLLDVVKKNKGRERISQGVISAAKGEIKNLEITPEARFTVEQSEQLRQTFSI